MHIHPTSSFCVLKLLLSSEKETLVDNSPPHHRHWGWMGNFVGTAKKQAKKRWGDETNLRSYCIVCNPRCVIFGENLDPWFPRGVGEKKNGTFSNLRLVVLIYIYIVAFFLFFPGCEAIIAEKETSLDFEKKNSSKPF